MIRFDICDAAPMLDIVGGSVAIASISRKVAGRIWSMEVLPRRRILDEEALFRCARSSAEHRSCTAQSPATPPNAMRVC